MKREILIVGLMFSFATLSRGGWELFHDCYPKTEYSTCAGEGACTQTVTPRFSCAGAIVGDCSQAGTAVTITTSTGSCSQGMFGIWNCGNYTTSTSVPGTANC